MYSQPWEGSRTTETKPEVQLVNSINKQTNKLQRAKKRHINDGRVRVHLCAVYMETLRALGHQRLWGRTRTRRDCKTTVAAAFGNFLPRLWMQGQTANSAVQKLPRLEIPLKQQQQNSTQHKHPFRVCTFNVLVSGCTSMWLLWWWAHKPAVMLCVSTTPTSHAFSYPHAHCSDAVMLLSLHVVTKHAGALRASSDVCCLAAKLTVCVPMGWNGGGCRLMA